MRPPHHKERRLRSSRVLDDSAFSDGFRRFLQTAVPSVDAAELLLALESEPQRWWRANELAAKLRPSTILSEAETARYLEHFQAVGLVAPGPDRRTQFRPGGEALADHVHMLTVAYKERPVTLFRVIYALRDPAVPRVRLHLGGGMIDFLPGAVTLGFVVAALFFLRFWRRTSERLFLAFAVAFLLLALNQALAQWVGAADERVGYTYLRVEDDS